VRAHLTHGRCSFHAGDLLSADHLANLSLEPNLISLEEKRMISTKKLLAAAGACLAALLLFACAAPPSDNTTPPTANANSNATSANNVNSAQPTTAAKPAGVDYDALAQKLVTENAGVKEGEVVIVGGGTRDAELLEDIAVNVRKVGAHPLLLMNSEQMTKRMWTDVPDKYDAQEPKLDMKLAELADAVIGIDSNETEGLLADVAPARLAARAKAGESVGETYLKRNVRQVNLGNGLYPTDWLAKRHGMSRDDLAKVFWAGVNVDTAQLQAKGEAVRKALQAAKEVHITNPNGTDLRVQVNARPVFFSDGVITADEAKKGGSDVQVWLPAGDVYLAPVAGTAEGTVVISQDWYQGKEIKNLKLTFKGGKLVSMTADSGLEPLKAAYDAVTAPGKDELGVLDIGVNPAARLPAGDKIGAWMAAGNITVTLGDNTWAGGTNSTPFGWEGFLPGSTMQIDGKDVIANGELKQ
jgi:leucyl aminopeptidase (aminopeptidase T)